MVRWITRTSYTDGTEPVGIYAPDGSNYVVESPGTEWVGIYHPSGAFWVTAWDSPEDPIYAPDGSYYIDPTLIPVAP